MRDERRGATCQRAREAPRAIRQAWIAGVREGLQLAPGQIELTEADCRDVIALARPMQANAWELCAMTRTCAQCGAQLPPGAK